MFQFRRVVRLFLLIAGVIAGMVAVIAGFFARLILVPPRQRLWSTPAELGMSYEDVQFPARDGTRLSGWFIPTSPPKNKEKAATLVIVHGWPWNRLGTAAETILTDLPGSSPVQLIHLAHALHREHYQVLMFDLRNHGLSARNGPVTFGLRESSDLLGALDYLYSRRDVDRQRIGVIGFSIGANTMLYALPQTNLIRAAVAVQPTSAPIFLDGYTHSLLGPLGTIATYIIKVIYQLIAGLRLSAISPTFTATGAGETPLLYIQSTGDRWGSAQDVREMIAATPNAVAPVFVESRNRFEGFQYVLDHPDVVVSFFEDQLD